MWYLRVSVLSLVGATAFFPHWLSPFAATSSFYFVWFSTSLDTIETTNRIWFMPPCVLLCVNRSPTSAEMNRRQRLRSTSDGTSATSRTPTSWRLRYSSSTTPGPDRSSGGQTKPHSSSASWFSAMHNKTPPPLIPFRSAGFRSPKAFKTKPPMEINSQSLPWRNSRSKPTSCAAFRLKRCPPCCASIMTSVSYYTTTEYHHFNTTSSRTSRGSSRLHQHSFTR